MIRLLAFLAAVLLWGGAAPAQTFPKLTGPVVDAANVLSPAAEADLTAKLEALQKDTKRQLVVATIPDLQGYPLEAYGNGLIRAWGIGLKGVDNGAILFIAPNEPKGRRGPRIEVGYGLEPILTDAFSSQVIRRIILPRLRAGDVDGAMMEGADALIAQLRASPDEAKARTDAAIAEFDQRNKRSGRSTGIGDGIALGLIFWVLVVGFIVLASVRRRSGRRYRDDSGTDWGTVALWVASEALRNSNHRSGLGGGTGSGWSSGGGGDWGGSGGGGGSDGSWGGGGWTGGGGGSGGGGGASGDW